MGERRLKRSRLASCAGLALAVQGCSSDKLVGRSDLVITPVGETPAPSLADFATTPVPFVIGPNDKLTVSVYGIPEATLGTTVDPSGKISVPIAGSITAAGNTSEQLAGIIAQRLRANHVLNPIVSVNVSEILSQSITVSGQVSHPGVYAVSGRVTLTGAIARAEGTSEFANEKYVVLFRTVSGRQYATLYDLRAINSGQVADPQVFPNDEVAVGESRARRIFRDVLAASGLITAPLVALIR